MKRISNDCINLLKYKFRNSLLGEKSFIYQKYVIYKQSEKVNF